MTLQAIFLLPTSETVKNLVGPGVGGGATLGTHTIYFMENYVTSKNYIKKALNHFIHFKSSHFSLTVKIYVTLGMVTLQFFFLLIFFNTMFFLKVLKSNKIVFKNFKILEMENDDFLCICHTKSKKKHR